jgi:predicted esterase
MPNRILSVDGREGWWFGYDDGSGQGRAQREVVGVPGEGGDNHALHLAASGFVRWGAGFGATLHPMSRANRGCAYDASVYAGVRLRARGSGRIWMNFADMRRTPTAEGGGCTLQREQCKDHPGVWLVLQDSWQTFEFPFCNFALQGWGGKQEPLEASTLVALHFRVGAREVVDAWIDDLSFYREEQGELAQACRKRCPMQAVAPSARIDPLFTTEPLSHELTLHTFEQPTKACGPITRRYLSYVPARLGPRTSAPVLIMLHGKGANAESSRSYVTRTRFEALAERDGFIVVYANAAPGAHTRDDPGIANSGAWRQDFMDDGQVDDVDYLMRVLADLAAHGVTGGDNPLYLAGLSNGGGMVLSAARQIPERISGVAAWMPFDGLVPEPVPSLVGTGLAPS